MSSLSVLQTLLVLVFVAVHGAVSAQDIQLSEAFGGSRGIAFSDINSLVLGQTLSSITIRAGDRIDAVALRVATPTELTLSHGGSGGTDNTLTLEPDEYITSMEIHWGKKSGSTLVFYLNVVTSAGNSIFGGTQTENNATVTAPDGFQLSGLFGRSEGAVDQLGVIWTRIEAAPLELMDDMGSNWYGTTIRNWVGPTISDASDTACYRETEAFGSGKTCPVGYNKNGTNCIAECPISYPVECFVECLPQNDDCLLEIFTKTATVAVAAFNTATAGVFSALFSQSKTVKQSFTCAANVIAVIKSLIYYLRYQQTTAPQGDTEELLAVAYQSDVVIFALPIAVCNCLGIPVSSQVKFSNVVLQVVETIVKQAITNGDAIVSSAANVLSLLSNSGASNSTTDANVDELQDLIDSNSTCGYQLKNLTDHVIASVNEIRNETPDIAVADIRVKVSSSPLVHRDIPTVTNNCMKELLSSKTSKAAYETRDLLRKTFGVIIEQLIETATTDLGASVAENEYMLEVANMGLTVLSGLDPTGIAGMMAQFVQPTCGPTAFLGEIDDGSLYDALGLTTVDEAFAGSYGTWTKEGDGVVNLVFESTDTKDVTVVIYTGGSKFATVKVDAGETVVWNSTIEALQDRAMYLDRWRGNVIGIPGSGGGSLVLWVPRASSGGHLTMHVRVNAS